VSDALRLIEAARAKLAKIASAPSVDARARLVEEADRFLELFLEVSTASRRAVVMPGSIDESGPLREPDDVEEHRRP
jgi:hypothetical protein